MRFATVLTASVLCACCQWGQAQQPVVRDSAELYRRIEAVSRKGKITSFLYELLFRPVRPAFASNTPQQELNQPNPFCEFEGKIIRRISIATSDPFGYTLRDTARVTDNQLYRVGNALHVKSGSFAIWNLLQIRKNTPFDTFRATETERLIRSQAYVREAALRAEPAGPDSVDVFIRVIDVWSIVPAGNASPTRLEMQLTESNFLGTGQRLDGNYVWNLASGRSAFGARYAMPNFRSSLLSTALSYNLAEDRTYLASLNLERPFYSPLARWAGGLYAASRLQRDSVANPGTGRNVLADIRSNTLDGWGGGSWLLFEPGTDNYRSVNFILTGRYRMVRYTEAPNRRADSTGVYTNEDLCLLGAGVSVRRYIRDRYIFKFGILEDVPVGKSYGVITGFRYQDRSPVWYLGGRLSWGNYYPAGYMSAAFEYGTYYTGDILQQGAFSADFTYFTHLFRWGGWRFRQFARPRVLLGFDRLTSDQLSLGTDPGIRGFNSPGLTGAHKLLLTLQTQSYAPWNVYGFRFGPYLSLSLGMLGDRATGFWHSSLFSQIGLGLLVKNEFLVISTFELSVSFFPQIPGKGNNIWKTNTLRSVDFGFRDFEFAQPGIVPYR